MMLGSVAVLLENTVGFLKHSWDWFFVNWVVVVTTTLTVKHTHIRKAGCWCLSPIINTCTITANISVCCLGVFWSSLFRVTIWTTFQAHSCLSPLLAALAGVPLLTVQPGAQLYTHTPAAEMTLEIDSCLTKPAVHTCLWADRQTHTLTQTHS